MSRWVDILAFAFATGSGAARRFYYPEMKAWI